MNRLTQYSFLIGGVLGIILTIGFFFQMPWATSLWMWPDGRLTYIFVASITAAIAAPLIWIGLTGEWSAAVGGAVNLFTATVGIALFIFQFYTLTQQTNLPLYAGVFVILALVNAGIYLWSRRLPAHDTRPIPRPVLYSFAVFAILLGLTAAALLLKTPTVFPWPLKPETSVVVGWIFAGAMLYFAYPFVRSGWSNAQGQLLGFLAYDLVLIVPFVQHFSDVLPEHRLSLTIYTAVLVYSGALAVYYLFINRRTLMWTAQKTN